VVADERDVGALRDGRSRLVRARPVPDRVAEAPDLVYAVTIDRGEYSGERGVVGVNV
jgi:hypothetical protein